MKNRSINSVKSSYCSLDRELLMGVPPLPTLSPHKRRGGRGQAYPTKAPRLILASASPRRRLLMKQAGFRFSIIPSHTSERTPRGMSPRAMVEMLALRKARAVSRRQPEDVVLGADTIVFINGKIIGKPRSHGHAREILEELSGSWQEVYTGVAVAWEGGNKERVGVCVSKVKLRKLTERDLRHASRRHLDKAGAYAVQEKNDPFVEKIEGEYDNVVGLPMKLVKKLLGRWGVQAFAKRF